MKRDDVARTINILYKIALVLFIVIIIFIGNIVFFPQKIPNSEYHLVIAKDQSLVKVATDLEQNNIIKSKRVFLVLLKLFSLDKRVNAGMYILNHPISLWNIINRITHGTPDQISLTILDGWTFSQLKKYVDSLEDVKHMALYQSESDIKNILKIPYPNLEGVFYPDTYYIVPGQSDLEVYYHAYKMMQFKAESLYNNRSINSTVKSYYQLLILASLIQKETSRKDDMILVSTVFNNRLRDGMKLQDDPSVFYGLRGHDKIIRKDFKIDTPYNTYLHEGLPLTPICIPSLDAMVAASKPLNKNNVYYFVAVGNGRTVFSKNYAEHMEAVDKYLKRQKR